MKVIKIIKAFNKFFWQKKYAIINFIWKSSVVIVFLTFTLSLNARKPLRPSIPSNDPVYFIGHIESDSLDVDSIVVYFYKEYLLYDLKNWLKVAVKIDNKNSFSFALPAIDNFGKMLLVIYYEGWHDRYTEYLIAPGDSIHMTILKPINETDIFFSGKGAAKYNCRRAIQKAFEKDFKEKRREIASQIKTKIFQFDSVKLNRSKYLASARERYFDLDNIDESLEAYRSGREGMLTALDNFKPQLSHYAYNVMRADILGVLGTYLHATMRTFFQFNDLNNPETKRVARELYTQYSALFNETFSDNVLSLSQSYPEGYLTYLLDKTVMELFIEDGEYSFKSAYFKVKNKYTGLMRERLLMHWLRTPFYNYINDRKEYDKLVEDAYALIKTPVLKELVGQSRKVAKGVDAYNFSLPNIEDKIVSLYDLRGKVVLQDMWFTGCTGCAQFAKRFKEEVYPNFINTKDFVVVSMSNDKDKATWLKSINSKKYTDSYCINLYEGANSPVAKHYDIVGRPFVLLIDKKGKIFSQITNSTKSEDIIIMIVEALERH